MSLEVMKQALEALEQVKPLYTKQHAIAALRQAIKQAEKQQAQEPKKWVEVECPLCGEMAVAHTHPVLTTPQPQREWVGLTEEEHTQIVVEASGWNNPTSGFFSVARAIEAKLKEKNT